LFIKNEKLPKVTGWKERIKRVVQEGKDLLILEVND